MSTPQGRMPRQVPFIIANEGCERFSFYGMRNILTTFLPIAFYAHLTKDAGELEAKNVFHTFVAGVYFFPLLGGWLSDRLFGKYRTIFWMSLLYCVGHALLAVSDVMTPTGPLFPLVEGATLAAPTASKQMFFAGLALIALGSGGIKPLVSTFVGDQFDQTNKHLAKVVFDIFYWMINFGSFFASLFMRRILDHWGPSVAFGIPGVLMFAATVILWLGRKRYVMVPPAPPDPHSFTRVVRTALTGGGTTTGAIIAGIGTVLAMASISLIWVSPSLGLVKPLCIALGLFLTGTCWGAWRELERARGVHPDEAVDGVRQVLRILVLFALVSPFWSLFDQKASTWVYQANDLRWPSWVGGTEMQALNPLLVMLLIPFNRGVLFPLLARRGIVFTQLQRMGLGIALAGVAWVCAAVLQLVVDAGSRQLGLAIVPGFVGDGATPPSLWWQLLPYIFLTLGEVLVSATGLEFAYSQAPRAMKGVLMAFWSLAVTFGNLWVLMVDETIKRPAVVTAITDAGISLRAFLMFFFAGFALLAALAFAAVARRYRMMDNYRDA
jgi:POT family proton-dependent oligopeptide transporter